MIDIYICPFCGRLTGMYPSTKCGYSVYGRGKGAIKQWFHNSCFNNLVLNQKIEKGDHHDR